MRVGPVDRLIQVISAPAVLTRPVHPGGQSTVVETKGGLCAAAMLVSSEKSDLVPIVWGHIYGEDFMGNKRSKDPGG